VQHPNSEHTYMQVQKLKNVLTAYSHHNRNVGYCQVCVCLRICLALTSGFFAGDEPHCCHCPAVCGRGDSFLV